MGLLSSRDDNVTETMPTQYQVQLQLHVMNNVVERNMPLQYIMEKFI